MGRTSETEFKALCEIVTQDIKANNIGFGKKTYIGEVMNLYDKSKRALKRCS